MNDMPPSELPLAMTAPAQPDGEPAAGEPAAGTPAAGEVVVVQTVTVETTATAPRHLYLVDGSGYIFRAFHALPPLSRPDGTPVNAVLGFTNMLVKLLEDAGTDRLAVIFDASGQSFRNQIYDRYKAQRPPPPPELVPQFALIREAVRAFNLPCIELEGFEADDLIATYARAARAIGDEVTILSSDKDLMQLVAPGITMLDPMKNRRIGPDEVFEKFGVSPDKVIEVQALCGDSVDNVPGVPGIGPKTAAELIGIYGDLETLLSRAHEIKQPKRRESLQTHAELARISKLLVTLRDDTPMPLPLEALDKRAVEPAMVRTFLETQGFRNLLARLEGGIRPPSGSRTTTTTTTTTTIAVATGTGAPAPQPNAGSVEQRYVLVQSEADLVRWITRAHAQGFVAFDTETTNIDALRAELVGVSLALAPGEACYIPVGHKPAGAGPFDPQGEPPLQIPRDRVIALLKPLMADPSVLKIAHNLKYDAHILAHYDVAVIGYDDTMLLSFVLEGGLHGHGLDELAQLHFGHTNIKFSDVCGTGKSQIGFAEVALDKALAYAAEDADITLRLHQVLKPRLAPERVTRIYETIERPIIPVVAAMERAGIKVDPDRLRRLSQDFAQRLAVLETDIHQLAGHSFNVGSPKQLAQVLFEEMRLAGGKRGKTGDYSTDSGVLEQLAEQGHAIAARMLDWRQLAKLKSTYADALVAQINPDTGRVHTSFALAATTTGRLSSTDPNLQNIPVRTEEGRKIRDAFVAEPGFRLLSVDYSQIELRLLAEIADIATLKDAFRDGIDIHALTASQVFGVPIAGMDPMVRRQAKAINFGIVYGISAFGLANQLGCGPGEAKRFIDAYFERFPGIRAYMDRMKEQARAKGFVETLFGRKCNIAGIADRNPARRGFAERQAINAPIQGSAADIVKRAMLRLPDALAKAGLGARMLLQVHDELLFEVAEAEIDATSELVRRVMADAVTLSVPMTAEAGTGLTWAEAH